MESSIIIFTEIKTNRIDYIFDFILRDFSGIDYRMTTDFDEFFSTNAPKINFSNQFLDNEINLNVDDILLENDIHTNTNYYSLNEIGKCFYWLSRYEEYIATPQQFDQHQRFIGSDIDYSQPIVDLICLEIQNKIKHKYPTIQFKERIFKQINTYDVDYAWKYLHHSTKIKVGSILKKILKGNFSEVNKQLNVLLNKEEDPYDTFDYIKKLDEKHQTKSIYFWLLGNYSNYDKNHHWKNKSQQDLIRKIAKYSDVGIHPSYQSNQDAAIVEDEINRLRTILETDIKKSRQHFLKLSIPNTYQQLLIKGIKEDYSMGFPRQLGFRAGTCTSFKWFDLSTNQQTLLTIYPLVAMDVTLKNYLKLTPEQAIEELKGIKQTIKNVNGTFITLFHQSNLNGDWYNWRKVYESVFE